MKTYFRKSLIHKKDIIMRTRHKVFVYKFQATNELKIFVPFVLFVIFFMVIPFLSIECAFVKYNQVFIKTQRHGGTEKKLITNYTNKTMLYWVCSSPIMVFD